MICGCQSEVGGEVLVDDLLLMKQRRDGVGGANDGGENMGRLRILKV